MGIGRQANPLARAVLPAVLLTALLMCGCEGRGIGQLCGGPAELPCDEGLYCNVPDGTCGDGDQVGVCRPTSDACPAVFSPVCGCDGRTYGNDCEAAAAGVNVRTQGKCPADGAICGSRGLPPCPDGDFCEFAPGSCGSLDEGGVCRRIPEACPAVFDPVCGCDGQTYGNECEANAAGVSVDHDGECSPTNGGKICGGIAGLPCGEGEFCRFEAGICGDGDQSGVCHALPDACPEIFAPVCGCDGKTYGNECEANAAGVSVRREGECPTTDGDEICGGIAGLPCKQGEFCQFETGTCGAADQSGLCRVLPEVCPAVVDPVCGCDGQTYDNECEAFQAGVSAQSEGECPTG